MKRKDFFKAAFFGIAACFLPSIKVGSGITIKKREDGETTMAAESCKWEDVSKADLKLQHAIIKSAPQGKYIDTRAIRNSGEYTRLYNHWAKRAIEKIKKYE